MWEDGVSDRDILLGFPDWDLTKIKLGPFTVTERFLSLVIDPGSLLPVLEDHTVLHLGMTLLYRDGVWEDVTKHPTRHLPPDFPLMNLTSHTFTVRHQGRVYTWSNSFEGEEFKDGYVEHSSAYIRSYRRGRGEMVFHHTTQSPTGGLISVFAGGEIAGQIHNIGPTVIHYRDGVASPSYNHYGKPIFHEEILDVFGYLPLVLSEEERMLWCLHFPQVT